MVGLFVALPRDQPVFYSLCLHQLTGLLLSRLNPWHWGTAALPRARKQQCLGSQGYQVLFPGDPTGDVNLPLRSSFGQREHKIVALLC